MHAARVLGLTPNGAPTQDATIYRLVQVAATMGRVFSAEAAAGPHHGATYPGSPLGTALKNSAALIRSGLGVKAIAVDSGGWDHHFNLSNQMSAGISDLASSLAAFFKDLGPAADRVTVVTLSEFGRRLGENDAAGVDHGYGNAVLVMGAGVMFPGAGYRKLGFMR